MGGRAVPGQHAYPLIGHSVRLLCGVGMAISVGGVGVVVRGLGRATSTTRFMVMTTA